MDNSDILVRVATLKNRAGTLELQTRDISLLRGLFECRVMTTKHVARLYFKGKRYYAKKRLQKLKAAAYIGERKRNANEESVLFLTRKAFVLLGNTGQLEGYPILGKNTVEARANVSERNLRHELDIMDVKTAFHAAAEKSGKFSILKFSTWPRLYEFNVSRDGYNSGSTVKPDGFINIHESEYSTKGYAHDFFLEVDRSSETQDILVEKAVSYLDFYKSGGFAVRNGGTRSDFSDFPFRVLMVFKSAERRNNIAERLLQNNPPILTHTWLTTLGEALENPFGAIWIQPKDYREAVSGTNFDAAKPIRTFAYRRQPERDLFIEAKIKKLRLLED